MLSLLTTKGRESNKPVFSLILGLVHLAKKATTKIVDSDTVKSILILKNGLQTFLMLFQERYMNPNSFCQIQWNFLLMYKLYIVLTCFWLFLTFHTMSDPSLDTSEP